MVLAGVRRGEENSSRTDLSGLTSLGLLVQKSGIQLTNPLTQTRVGVNDTASTFHCPKKGFDFVASLLLCYCFSC